MLKYLLGIVSYGWRYVPKYGVQLYEFSGSNWKGSIEDMKITLGCCFSLGSTMISWMRRNKTFVTLSTIEAKYILAFLACCEGLWIRNILFGLSDHMLEPTMLFCDNQSYVKLNTI